MYIYYGIGYELMEKNRGNFVKLEEMDFRDSPTIFDNLPENVMTKVCIFVNYVLIFIINISTETILHLRFLC